MNCDILAARLAKHEGLRLKPYRDSVGKLTIGIGRNLDDVGISAAEAMALCLNDIDGASAELDGQVPWWRSMNDARQEVLCEMRFNMGWARLAGFRKFLAAAAAGDFEAAAHEMLSSQWATQVGKRAITLADARRKGSF